MIYSNKLESEDMEKLLLLTKDKYMRRAIELELYGKYECIESGAAPRVIVDIDSVTPPDTPSDIITVSRLNKNADIHFPFEIGTLADSLIKEGPQGDKIALFEKFKTVMIHNEEIKLTELEFALFKRLYSERGGYVTRECLAEEVFGDARNGGMLNLYIHYLRDKLEIHDEKIILSTRKLGYRINKSYFGGELC